MDELLELKRKAILGQQQLDATKEQLEKLRKELDRERQLRLAGEESSRMTKVESEILSQITGNCLPGSEQHLLTLLKSGGFLEIDSDRILIKATDQYNLPSTFSLEAGLSKVIAEQFPHFAPPLPAAIAPEKRSGSSVEKLHSMSDEELLFLMEKPEKVIDLVNDL